MKTAALLLLAALTGSAAARPVHVALKPSAAVSANADGFFTLGAVADVSGGAAALRMRLAAIPVGRAPLCGESRRLTRGDLALKLRQAGYDPDKAAVLEGADAAEVTTEAPPAPNSGGARSEGRPREEGAASSAPTKPSPPAPPELGAGGASALLIHRGDPITIVIQTGPLTITAPGVAREGGGAGQTIRVHREGVMTDLSVRIMDAQTVHLEI